MMKFEELQEDVTFNDKLKYVFKQIKHNWRNTSWWSDKVVHYIVKNYYKITPNRGINIMEKDWDNVIILDACRYDTFCEVYGKNVDHVISRGSATPDFLEENFVGRYFPDTVYVTANPWVNKLCKNSFYKLFSVWMTEWDEELNTVHPMSVVEKAVEIAELYPDKRIIVHFMQPHAPYLDCLELSKMVEKCVNIEGIKIPDPFELVIKGTLNIDELYKYYQKNLKIVLKFALRLTKKLEGKTVITSDHGEAFGEYAFPFPIKIYEHIPYVRIPVLVKVPWLVFDSKERKEIRANDKSRDSKTT